MNNIELLLKEGITEENFPDFYEGMMFTTVSSDYRTIQLCPNGDKKPVVFSNREEYCDLVIQYRLHEYDRQVDAIRHGLGSIIPLSTLSVLSWRDLELRICGDNDVDIEMLKLETEYSGCNTDDPHIQYFWQAISSFTNEQKQKLVTFIWARSRLPLTRPFENKFKIQAHHRSNATTADTYYPETHTCFFILDLPRYSSLEVMKDKLLYSIENCTAIDGDGNRASELSWDDI